MTHPLMPPAPPPISLAVNMTQPHPGIFRLEVQLGPVGTRFDLPIEQAEGLFTEALRKIARMKSGIILVPGGALPQNGTPL